MSRVSAVPHKTSIESLDKYGKNESLVAVDQLLRKAVRLRAQSLHLEPRETELLVRMRIDGAMRSYPSLSNHMSQAIVNELKKRADISTLYPFSRDGTFEIDILKTSFSAQVSVLPTLYGDRLVIELHHKDTDSSLEALGLWGENLLAVQGMLAARRGLILLAGDHASETNTIMKAMVSLLEHPSIAIAHLKADQTSAVAQHKKILLAMQASPDVITVQNISSRKGFNAAQHASRHHLVIASIAAASPEAALTQITHYSEDLYDTSKDLLGVVYAETQALLCNSCAVPHIASKQTMMPLTAQQYAQSMGLKTLSATRLKKRGTQNCKDCGNIGTNGKLSIFQINRNTLPMKKYFVEHQPYGTIPTVIQKTTILPLRDDFLAKASNGIIAYSTKLDAIT